MKKEVYDDLKSTVPNFDASYTARVPTSKIQYNKQISQVRQAGHITSKVPRFAEIMKQDPNKLPPASVVCLPNGDFELKDGCTRELAAERINEPLWISWYHDTILQPTPDEWEDLQMDFNDLPLGTPSSADDIKAYIGRQQQSGATQHKVGFPYGGNEKKYIAQAGKIYRDKLKNSGKDLDWFKTQVENALAGHIGIKYENYNKKTLFDFYKTLTGFAGKAIGDISNKEVVFAFTDPGHRNPNVIGSIAEKRMDNPGVQYTLVYSPGSLAGKDDQAIFNERKIILDWAKKVNKYYPGWIGKLYFAPVIKCGPNKENMYQLIKAM